MKKRNINMILIALAGPIPYSTITSQHLNAIRKAAPFAEIVVVHDQKEWEKRAGEIASRVQVAFAPWTWHSRFKEMPNLQWIQQTGAGANWLLKYPEIVESDLILTSGSGYNAIPVAEHIMCMILTLARGIQHHIKYQNMHEWNRSGVVIELEGTTMGLIGVGKVGLKTAEKAKGMNIRVLGLRRNPEIVVSHIERMYGRDGLKDILAEADWVVLTAPMTPETIGMIGENELKAMKKSAYIINVARGSLIQEKALVKALQEGWIAGAGLDVFEKEPLPADSPLWDMDNVIITPHYGYASPHNRDRLIKIFTENLRRFQEGEPMLNLVDKRLGY